MHRKKRDTGTNIMQWSAMPIACMTPRKTATLHHVLATMVDFARQDVAQHANRPVASGDGRRWSFFDRLPAGSWQQDAVWRQRCIDSIDRLARAGRAGESIEPQCMVEELVLHLAIADAEAVMADEEPAAWLYPDVPEAAGDDDWEACRVDLFQDLDFLQLYRADSRSSDAAAWFAPFTNA